MLGRDKRRVRVHVQDGPTIEGTLAGRTRHTYVIWAPRIVREGQKSDVEVSGHVEVPRERVLWWQVIG